MLGNPRHSWILDSTPWIPDSIYWIPDLFQWNLDSGFELLVGFRIPTPVFRIPRPRIPDSTSKNFQDSGFQMQKFPGFRNPDSFTWGDWFDYYHVSLSAIILYCSQSSLVSRTFFDHKAVHYDCRLVQILNCTLTEATVLQSLLNVFFLL